MEAGHAIEQGIRNVLPETKVLVKPLADGGEGTTEALVEGLGGDMVQVQVHGPLETPVNAAYGVIGKSNTAIMEMAAAAGIILVGKDKRPLDATTYGVGEMIRDAITRGCREFIIGIGGSATNDGGIGMLTALGYEFQDAEGKPAGIGAGALYKVAKICDDKVMPELKDCHFRIACDVTNPLCGENGSTYIYGPQKGVTVELRDELDHAMGAYAQVVKAYNGTDYAKTPGAGAAGGLGFAFLWGLPKVKLKPGIDIVLEAVGLTNELKDADVVVTGEGCLDFQTAMGKVPVGVAKTAKNYNCKVIAFAGSVTEEAKKCNEKGIDAFFSILPGVCSLDEAMDTEIAQKNMRNAAEQVFRLVLACGKEKSSLHP